MTEFELFKALRPHYPAAEYALLPQAANGTGSRANRHCDALALSLWPSRGLYLSGFEIKSYRGDWVRELRDPAKAEEIGKFCNYWWIVAAGPFVKEEDELPPLWGLMVWDAEKQVLKKVKAAPFREAQKPDLPFIAAILRKSQEVVTPDAALAEAHAAGLKEGKDHGELNAGSELRRLRELRNRVTGFEEESGIQLASSWTGGREIGEAVKQILEGTVMRERDSLRRTAARILEELGPLSVEEAPKRKAARSGR